ncbi:tetratricopeptide repeat protein [Methyloprofundus sp.]|uniref:tetratricopeptide repeat protein n=1 Tax=Methyloprofundus sp. TaxID=2020875 RepID=UPI003D0A0320
MKILKKPVLLVLLAAALLCLTDLVWAKKAPKTDYISLAATMLKDGHYDRALLSLQSVDLEDEDTDLVRFYTLQGLAYMNLNDMLAAKDSLQQAIKQGQQDKVIYVYLAQVNYALKEYQEVIVAVDKVGNIVVNYPTLLEMKAQSHWQLKQASAAIETLNNAQAMFSGDYRFMRRKVFYLVELKLYQQAAQLGQQYLNLSAGKASDYIAIGNALRLSKEYQQTLYIMEAARLRFPDNVTIAKVLAHTYIDMGQLNSGAFILEQAAQYDPKLIAEAAEVYRRAGRLYKALTLNPLIRDHKVKLKQRLAVFLALKRYEKAANMKSSLYRTGLLDDQNIRYALAYAYFSSGQFTAASKQIDSLTDSDLFKKGLELRRMMEACKEEPWQCT